jgi:hypothetical protein
MAGLDVMGRTISLSVLDMSISVDGFFGSYGGTTLLEDPVVVRGDRLTQIRNQVHGPGVGSEHKPWEDAS